MDTFLQDLRFAARTLLRNRGFTAAAVLTLTLGIGANTAIFSVVDAVLLRPLPYRQPDQLVAVWNAGWRSPAEFAAVREATPGFEGVGAFHEGAGFSLTGTGEPARLTGARVSSELFQVLGATPALGRGFGPGADQAGAERAVVLGHALWRERFGGDPSVVGRAVTLDGEPHTVIGVMRPDFRFPTRETQVWVAARFEPGNVGDYWGNTSFQIVGRLRPGVTPEVARGQVRAVAARTRTENPLWTPAEGYVESVEVAPLREKMVGEVRPLLLLLLGAVGLVLLIACANVANLMLARAAGREQEVAVRAALGAGRGRLVRQFITESLLLTGAAAVLAVLLTTWTMGAFVALLPPDVPRAGEIRMDPRVLGFTAVAALVTGCLFGLAPALRALRIADTLRQAGRGVSPGRSQRRLSGALVVGEIALAVVLVTGAMLVVQSFWRLRGVDPGFRPERLVTARVDPLPAKVGDDARARAFYQGVLERAAQAPGVEAAGASSQLPVRGASGKMAFRVDGAEQDPGNLPMGFYEVVTPDYLRTMGVSLKRGRGFTGADRDGAPPVALVNEAMARRFWPGQDPVGKRVGYPWPSDWMTVVGVVADVANDGLGKTPEPAIYRPFAQAPAQSMRVAVRGAADPAVLTAGLRAAVAGVDPDAPLSEVQTMEARVSASVAQPRFTAVLLLSFALVALALGAVGVYGVIAYAVSRRTREIGVRMALGAHGGDVLRMVVRQGAVLAAAGIAVGLVGAFAATRALRGMLYGIAPLDPATFVAVPLALAAVALLASYLPARRAARVDPMVALRSE
jgi:putative ABC transport system permease protein